MKTLKQLLKQYYFFDENSEPNKFTYEDDTIKAVIEWLEQKRQYAEEYHMLQRKYACKWLLEELKHENIERERV